MLPAREILHRHSTWYTACVALKDQHAAEQAPAPSSTAAPATPRAAPDPAAEPTTPGPGQDVTAASSPAGIPVNPEEMAGEEAGEEAPDAQLSSTDVPGSAWSHTAPLALVLAAVALAVV